MEIKSKDEERVLLLLVRISAAQIGPAQLRSAQFSSAQLSSAQFRENHLS